MTRRPDRRTVLLAAGAAAALGGVGPARSAEVAGAVEFEGGAAIPKGVLRIVIDDPALRGDDAADAVETSLESDGGATSLAFSLPLPSDVPGARVVARLERADGWLLARGSAEVEDGPPLRIVLRTVMY